MYQLYFILLQTNTSIPYVFFIIMFYSITFLNYTIFLIPSDVKYKNIILFDRYVNNMTYLLIFIKHMFIIKYNLLEILYYFLFISVPS